MSTASVNSPPVGTLWVVATPLGHLDDLSPRAQATLEAAAVVAAEDTRVTQRLVTKSKDQRWVALNEHSESGWVDELIQQLKMGLDVALVSDAGTPLISDPGYRLVRAAHDQSVPVRPVPGPSAAIAALSVSGLATDRFWFEGFLPPKLAGRRRRLSAMATLTVTQVFYVPARDLEAVLSDFVHVYGADRRATVAREMTKQHETIRHDRLSDLLAWVSHDSNQAKGEATLVVQGSAELSPTIEVGVLADALRGSLPPSQAAKVLARASGLSRAEAWQWIVQESSEPSQDEAP